MRCAAPFGAFLVLLMPVYAQAQQADGERPESDGDVPESEPLPTSATADAHDMRVLGPVPGDEDAAGEATDHVSTHPATPSAPSVSAAERDICAAYAPGRDSTNGRRLAIPYAPVEIDLADDWATPILDGPLASLTPSTTDLLAAAVTASESGAATTVTVAPLRPTAVSPLWGLQFGLGYDSKTESVSLATLYRVDARWLVPGSMRSELYRACEEVTRDRLPIRQLATAIEGGRARMEAARDARGFLNSVEETATLLDDAAWTLRAAADRSGANSAVDEIDHAMAALTTAQERVRVVAVPPGETGSLTGDTATAKARLVDALRDLRQAIRALARAYPTNLQLPESDEIVEVIERRAREAAHFTGIGLLPTLTVGYRVGLFPFAIDASTDPNAPLTPREAIQSHALTFELTWRLGVFFELGAAFALQWQRASSIDSDTTDAVDPTQITSRRTLSTNAVVILPWLVGASPYDSSYQRTGLQQGVGIGVAFDWTECDASGELGRCTDNVTSSWFAGGILDLRLTKAIRPRVRIGYRRSSVLTDPMAPQDGFDVRAMLLVVLDTRN